MFHKKLSYTENIDMSVSETTDPVKQKFFHVATPSCQRKKTKEKIGLFGFIIGKHDIRMKP